MPRFRDIADRLADLRRRSMYRRRRVVDSPQGREIMVDGRRLLNFCSNDYLGLAGDPRLQSALVDGAKRWGVGAGASHLVCGHTRAHHELEEAVARFTGRPRALVFSSGYAANMGVIGALMGPGDRVFEDRLNHASLLDGGWISRADFTWYRHCDAADLSAKLAEPGGPAGDPARTSPRDRRRSLVVSDGTFSMDGDCAPLPALVQAARRGDAWLMMDDAHGIGVHGPGGRGLVDPATFTGQDVQLLVGTFGKALGTAGAFVAADEVFIEMLVQKARTYIYTTALPAALAEATRAALQIAEEEEWRRDRLRELVARFRAGAEALMNKGLQLPESFTPIQPVILGDPARTLAVSAALEEAGCLVTAIRPPTVPVGTSRLRVTFTAAHEAADVDRLLEALAAALQVVPAS